MSKKRSPLLLYHDSVSQYSCSAQHFSIRKICDLVSVQPEQLAEHRLIILACGMSELFPTDFGFGQPNRRADASYPADSRQIDVTGKAALTEVRIAVEIFGGLHYSCRDSFALQYQHDLVRRVLRGPRFN